MRPLSDHEKRTIRLGTILVVSYLVLFYGVRTWSRLESRRSEYQRLVQKARHLTQELQPYEKKSVMVERLRTTFQIDPGKLSKTTLVAEASAAIQKAATSGGVQLGPLRESAARATGKELASMQLEGVGPVPAVLGLLHRIQTLGYPLVLDSIQLTPDPAKPGTLKINLTLVILDFDQWKAPEAGHV